MSVNPIGLLSTRAISSTKQAVPETPETPVEQSSAWFHTQDFQDLAGSYSASDEQTLYDMWRLFRGWDGLGLEAEAGLTDLGEKINEILGFNDGNFTNILFAGQPAHDTALLGLLDQYCNYSARVTFKDVIRDTIRQLFETLDDKVKDALRMMGWPIDAITDEWILSLPGNPEAINQLQEIISRINLDSGSERIRLRGQGRANNLNVLHDLTVLINTLAEILKGDNISASSIGILTEEKDAQGNPVLDPDGNPIVHFNHISVSADNLFARVEQLTVSEMCTDLSRAPLTEEIRRTFIILASRLSAEAKAELHFDAAAEADPDKWLTTNLDLLRQYFAAHVEKLEPGSVSAGAQGIEITLTGQFVEFPSDIAAITVTPAADSGITIVPGSLVRVSESQIKFKVNVAANAPITPAGTLAVAANANLTISFDGVELKGLLKIENNVCAEAILQADYDLVYGALNDGDQSSVASINDEWMPRLTLGAGYLFPPGDNDQIGEVSNAGSLALGGGVERDFDISTSGHPYVLETEVGAAGQYEGTFGEEDLPNFGQEQVWLRAWGRALGGDWAPPFRLSFTGNFEQNDIATLANPSTLEFGWQTGVSFPMGPVFFDLGYNGEVGTINDGNLDKSWTQQMIGIAFGGQTSDGIFGGLAGVRGRFDNYGLGYVSNGETLGGEGSGYIQGLGVYGALRFGLPDGWEIFASGSYDMMDPFNDYYQAALRVQAPSDLYKLYLEGQFSNNHLQDLGGYESYRAAVGADIPLGSWAEDDHWITPDSLAVEVGVGVNDIDFDIPELQDQTAVNVGLNLEVRFGEVSDPYEQFAESGDAAAALYINDQNVVPGVPGAQVSSENVSANFLKRYLYSWLAGKLNADYTISEIEVADLESAIADLPVPEEAPLGVNVSLGDVGILNFSISDSRLDAGYVHAVGLARGWVLENEDRVNVRPPAGSTQLANQLIAAAVVLSDFRPEAGGGLVDNRFEGLISGYWEALSPTLINAGYFHEGISEFYADSRENFIIQLNLELRGRVVGQAVMALARFLLQNGSLSEISAEQVQIILQKVAELKPQICPQAAAPAPAPAPVVPTPPAVSEEPDLVPAISLAGGAPVIETGAEPPVGRVL
ncbi:MAG: hypothetical protein WC645_01740 [Candidatus Margulisiibacteriota bacterium]